jgi:hypothetical protein
MFWLITSSDSFFASAAVSIVTGKKVVNMKQRYLFKILVTFSEPES